MLVNTCCDNCGKQYIAREVLGIVTEYKESFFCRTCNSQQNFSWQLPKNQASQPVTIFDPVTRPKHSMHAGIETITVIEAWECNYNIGNVVKYVSRWKEKNGLEDLKKARWYLEREIKTQEEMLKKQEPTYCEKMEEKTRPIDKVIH